MHPLLCCAVFSNGMCVVFLNSEYYNGFRSAIERPAELSNWNRGVALLTFGCELIYRKYDLSVLGHGVQA